MSQAAPEQVIGTPEGATRARRDEARDVHRRLDGEVVLLENFERRLTRQIHEKQEAGRDDFVRELVQRRISVRSRLEEMRVRRARAAEVAGRA